MFRGFILSFFILVVGPRLYAESPTDVVNKWRANTSDINELAKLFSDLDPSLEDGEKLLGELRRYYSGADYENLVHDFAYIFVEHVFAKLERNHQPHLSRALRNFRMRNAAVEGQASQIDSRNFLRFLHFSQINFESAEDLAQFYWEDAMRMLPSRPGSLEEDIKNILMIHFLSMAPSIEAWMKNLKSDSSFEEVAGLLRILEFPAQLMNNLSADRFFPSGIYRFAKKDFNHTYRRYWENFFASANSADQFVLAANAEILDAEEYLNMKKGLLIKYLGRFGGTQPDGNQLIRYLNTFFLELEAVELELNPIFEEIRNEKLDAVSAAKKLMQYFDQIPEAKKTPAVLNLHKTLRQFAESDFKTTSGKPRFCGALLKFISSIRQN